MSALVSSRRGLFGAATVFAAAPGLALTKTTISDPVLPLWQRYTEFRRQADVMHEHYSAMREALVAIYGEPGKVPGAWSTDPRYPEFRDALERSNDLDNRAYDELDKITQTTPTTVAGLLAKVQAALVRFPPESEGSCEEAARAALRDTAVYLATICEGARS